MPKFQKISHAAVRLGEALPWHVYDSTGKLLLEKGFVVETENQLEALILRGMFLTEEDARTLMGMPQTDETKRSTNPFADMKSWLADLESGYKVVGERHPDSVDVIYSLSDRITALCDGDPDACLAMVHIHSVEPSPSQQTLFYVVLAHVVAKRLNYEKDRLRRMISAALTSNIALMPYLERLNQSNKPLTDKLREIINKHPTLGATALRQLGVADELWLKIVEQHHEKVDGTGYPNGVKGADLMQEAKLLALIERYTAMVMIRGYRRRLKPEEALKEILLDAQKDKQDPIYEAFYKAVSRHPPGTFVKLANGEVAIVIRREEGNQVPLIKSVINPGGSPYHGAFQRDSQHKDFRVTESVVPGFVPLLNLQSLWDYA